jgi:hypothetical protein
MSYMDFVRKARAETEARRAAQKEEDRKFLVWLWGEHRKAMAKLGATPMGFKK